MTEPFLPGIPMHERFAPRQVRRDRGWADFNIVELLTLEPLDDLLFRNRVNQRNINGALFGGQVIAQALAAACGTVGAERPPHSLHGYFLRAGNCDLPVIFQVDRSRDGGSFSTRRVVALQKGVPILHMECSFHVPEPGFDHQSTAPDVPPPEAVRTMQEIMQANADSLGEQFLSRFQETGPFEIRPIDERQVLGTMDHPERSVWIRVPSAGTSDNPLMHQLVMTYLSDFWLGGTPLSPHVAMADSGRLLIVSLDHAVWFHRPVRADEWLLYHTVSPSASAGTGLTRGQLYDRSGALVATVMQETLFRQRR